MRQAGESKAVTRPAGVEFVPRPTGSDAGPAGRPRPAALVDQDRATAPKLVGTDPDFVVDPVRRVVDID